ncbi:unnamed protein product [Kuraishia capsulata CBS 1993]|uniref:Helicase C-terminal domain-containing protein n=1 Tax=Kuraishia capsulata CBS 1993 TaxID=1382522 RepID=W6MS81_9ASCO|nr:uncharacterized protein KUCA_T00005541001 [Kuraishia capsulata CBS 1993]CDK29549.1 unnamed protein product [Kuraishia capsulata CBS 1993]
MVIRHRLEPITSITNDLSNFCALGTLFFYALPRVPANGAEAPDGWFWFDTPFNYNLVLFSPSAGGNRTFSAIVADIRYLVDRGYLRVTYRVFQLHGLETIAVVRLYALPADVKGNTVVREFRETISRFKKTSAQDTKYRTVMGQLIGVLDYTATAWNISSSDQLMDHIRSGTLLFPMTSPWSEFSLKKVGSTNKLWPNEEQSLSFELKRMAEECSILPTGPTWSNARNQSSNVRAEERLLEAYENVKSPSFAHLNSDKVSKLQKEIIHSILSDEIPGLKSDLYTYQRQSVAKMLEREYFPVRAVMPNLLRVTSTKQLATKAKDFFFDMNTYQIVNYPETFTTPRGGILAENMGLGKTLICLALVCASKLELSVIPPQHHFYERSDPQVQSLSTYCVRQIGKESIPWKAYIDRLPSNCIRLLQEYTGFFEVSEADNMMSMLRRTRLRSESDMTRFEKRKVYLCSTTLVVTPDNIWHQWTHEIEKHVKDGYLNVLYFRNKDSLLGVDHKTIIASDMVIMAISCFTSPASVSLMKNIHWKRFIIDEGHSMTSKTSNAVYLAKEMSADRKWVITGTPTAGLTRLHVNEEQDKAEQSSVYTAKKTFDAKDDLSRIGAIVQNFLKIDPWASSSKLWRSSILEPFLAAPYNFDIQLQEFLSCVLVRHSMADVETEVKLPPLHHMAVFLEPSYFDKLSINLYTAVLATNAVTSERTDRDYMFHPNNRPQLRRLITNLRRATFFWTGFTIDDLDALVAICKTALEKKDDAGNHYYSPEDRQLLVKSVYFSKKALANPRWRTASAIQEMNYYVEGLPQLFTSSLSIEVFSKDISVYGAPQLLMAQRIFLKNRFVRSNELLETRLLEEVRPFWANYWKKAAGKTRRRENDRNGISEKISYVEGNSQKIQQNGSAPKHTGTLVTTTGGKRRLSDSSNEAMISLKKDSQIQNLVKNAHESDVETATLLGKIKTSRIVGTASAKLSYMAARLLEHQLEGTKSIVFYEFEDSAYYLTEMLDILGVGYLMYATYLKAADRPKNLDQFSDSPNGLALIMDLKLAAHGLNIVAATRVYFLNPVWDRAVEAQAVKRAHRIGQKNVVRVETLMLKNTIEEEMYNKRFKDGNEINEISDHDLIDDSGMQEFVMRHDFLRIRNGEEEQKPVVAPAVNVERRLSTFGTTETDGYGLLEPKGSLQPDGSRIWDLPLFSQTSLERLSEHMSKVKEKKAVANEAAPKPAEKRVKFI